MTTTLSIPIVATMLTIGVASTAFAQTPAPPPSGIFVEGSGGSLTPVPSAMSMDVQSHGMAKSVLTQGISKPSQTVRFPGASAEFEIKETQPVFFFRFVDSQQMSKYAQENPMAAMAAMSGGATMLPGSDAKSYVLAKMIVDGDARVASSKGMETFKLQVQKKSATEFEVHVVAPLAPGQYAFYFGAAGAAPSQIWAFTVR